MSLFENEQCQLQKCLQILQIESWGIALPVAAGKNVLRVATGSAPVFLQTGTGVGATKEVPCAGRTITGRKGGIDITKAENKFPYLQQTQTSEAGTGAHPQDSQG